LFHCRINAFIAFGMSLVIIIIIYYITSQRQAFLDSLQICPLGVIYIYTVNITIIII